MATYGYQIADKYGSLGPLNDDRLGRLVYYRKFLYSDTDNTRITGGPVFFEKWWDLSFPDFSIYKGVIGAHVEVVNQSTNFWEPVSVKDKLNFPDNWYTQNDFGIWRETQKTFTIRLGSNPGSDGNYIPHLVYMYMYA